MRIFINDYSLLVDPWFFGKVFNNSWSLLRETNASNLDKRKSQSTEGFWTRTELQILHTPSASKQIVSKVSKFNNLADYNIIEPFDFE